MTDTQPAASTEPLSAGALLRHARQAQGMHIATLAASIKVPQRKLEALEADRYQDLPDTTYTRALAKTVCRTLKIDATPVLALLPPATDHSLERVLGGLNTPFRDRPERMAPTAWRTLTRPTIFGPGALILAALLVYLLPHDREGPQRVRDSPSVAATGASATVATTPASVHEPASAASVPKAAEIKESHLADEPLQLRTSAPSWIEVRDANDALVFQRLLQPGEAIGLSGRLPLSVKVGNAANTHLSFRGRVIDLTPLAHGNVARVELQ